MKIRTGFVSNSSSSSFVIAVKASNLTDARRIIKETLQAPKGHPMAGLIDGIATEVANSIGHGCDCFESIDEYQEKTREWGSFPEKDTLKLIADGFTVWQGSWEDQDGDMERLLCESDIHLKTDDVVIIHDGGY